MISASWPAAVDRVPLTRLFPPAASRRSSHHWPTGCLVPEEPVLDFLLDSHPAVLLALPAADRDAWLARCVDLADFGTLAWAARRIPAAFANHPLLCRPVPAPAAAAAGAAGAAGADAGAGEGAAAAAAAEAPAGFVADLAVAAAKHGGNGVPALVPALRCATKAKNYAAVRWLVARYAGRDEEFDRLAAWHLKRAPKPAGEAKGAPRRKRTKAAAAAEDDGLEPAVE
ncbi:hypothetical protein DFJ73DRAFT_788496 [Zopfochytrium polystomum]|nr:hypothetical protein DFJ73DRAFT_788496 [Zopfochytrium polystomum]